MSPELRQIRQLSESLVAMASQQDWPAMLQAAEQRQQALEQYFAHTELPDPKEIVRKALTEIQAADQALLSLATKQRQQLLTDAVDLRQRWQTSSSYQQVQNLNP